MTSHNNRQPNSRQTRDLTVPDLLPFFQARVGQPESRPPRGRSRSEPSAIGDTDQPRFVPRQRLGASTCTYKKSRRGDLNPCRDPSTASTWCISARQRPRRSSAQSVESTDFTQSRCFRDHSVTNIHRPYRFTQQGARQRTSSEVTVLPTRATSGPSQRSAPAPEPERSTTFAANRGDTHSRARRALANASSASSTAVSATSPFTTNRSPGATARNSALLHSYDPWDV